MSEREPRASDDFLDQEGPGADPGDAYARAVDDGEEPRADEDGDDQRLPDAGDVYRSGS